MIGSNSAGERGVAMVESCKPVADLGLKRRKAGKCTGRQTWVGGNKEGCTNQA